MTEEFAKLSTAQTPKSEYATLSFLITQLINQIATVALVRVVSVSNDGDVSPVGTVDVSPLVDQMTGAGETMPHGTIFSVPYLRIQGGANAVILDPQAGDIGMCGFCSRDISALKADPAAALGRAPSPGAPPGSRRAYAWSDGLYLGGFLNAVPAQYVRFSATGIELVSPTKVTLQAPAIEFKGPVTGTETAVFAGNVTGQGTSLHTHLHNGVTIGAGNSGPPV